MYGYDDDAVGFFIICCFFVLAVLCFVVVFIALSEAGI